MISLICGISKKQNKLTNKTETDSHTQTTKLEGLGLGQRTKEVKRIKTYKLPAIINVIDMKHTAYGI